MNKQKKGKWKRVLSAVALALGLFLLIAGGETAEAAAKKVRYGDTLKIRYRQKRNGAIVAGYPELANWSAWSERTVEVTGEVNKSFLVTDGDEDYGPSLLLRNKKLIGKKVGDTVSITVSYGDGDAIYQIKIKKIIHKPSGGKQMVAGGHAVKKGRYIYFSYNMRGKRMGIVRLDTKTMKKKEICTYKYEGKRTNGYSNLILYGNYIYCTYNKGNGTDSFDCYVCRVHIKSGKRELLTEGEMPVIYKGKLYFIRHDYYWGTDTLYQMAPSGNPSTIREVTSQAYSIEENNMEFDFLGNYLIYREPYYDIKKRNYHTRVVIVNPKGRQKVLADWLSAE